MFSPQEYSVNHSINACSSVEENVDTLSHQESDHEQLKAENNELRYDTDNIAPHPEYSVNHSINACSSNEKNLDLLSHQESHHEQLKEESKEFI